MRAAAADTYDEVPYASHAYPHTQPDQMAVVARLFGLTHPKLETARVLELGCAGGGNILPLALRYPKASFVGIDLSGIQIAAAKAQAEALNLSNIRFYAQDILALDPKQHAGAFDYIICHGVYSWVPEAVSAHILSLCHECLTPNGLALVSYNTLPGWNAVRSLRDMMRFHVKELATPAEKTAEARRLLRFLSETAAAESSYKRLIDEEISMISSLDDSYFYHDHLEGENRQYYFREFMKDASRFGLDYVGDGNLSSMFAENLAAKAADTLKKIADPVLREQYIDFVLNRRFRSSILRRTGKTAARAPQDAQIMDFHLTSGMVPETASGFPATFTRRGKKGAFLAQTEAAAAVFREICRSGMRPIAAAEAVARAEQNLKGAAAGTARTALIENGLKLARHGFIALHVNSPAFEETISDRPVVSPLARLQAAQAGCRAVTTLAGNSAPVDGGVPRVLTLLDGSRTLDEVAAALGAPDARQTVDRIVPQLAARALLVS